MPATSLRAFGALALVAAPAVLAAQAPTTRAAVVARIDSLAEAFLREAPATGLTLGVVRGRDTLVLEGYGYADRDTRRPAGPNTVYRVGSISKQFTAAAILQQVEQGRLSLSDTLGRFLPRYPKWGGVTIRQLLNHTSGIPSYTASPRWAARMTQPLAPDSLLAIVYADTMDFAPGTQWRYDNTGYFLLGLVLEQVTRTPYARYVEERFFRPLGMRSARYCPDVAPDTSFAAGYDRRPDGTVAPTRAISMTSPFAAGALCFSVRDYLRWQAALTGGRIVRPATYERMSRPDSLTGGRRIPSGYGWGLQEDSLEGRRVVSHDGDINGFSADQIWVPSDSLRVVVFTNSLGSRPARLTDNVVRAVLGLPLVAPPRTPVAVALPAERRAAVLGTYDVTLPNGATLPFVVAAAPSGDGITGQLGPQQPAPLVHVGDGVFRAAFDLTLRITFPVENGTTRVRIEQRGATFGGPRRP